MGSVVSRDVSRSVAAGSRTPETQTVSAVTQLQDKTTFLPGSDSELRN